MKKTVENFGTAERTQKAYEQVIKKLDRIDSLVTTASYFIAFFCIFCVIGLIVEIL